MANLINETGTARRLIARRVDEDSVARRAIHRARKSGRPAYAVSHGGGVANKYGYPAQTECVVALALPTGEHVAILARAAANKVTLAGAAKACCAELLVPALDDRYSAETDAIAAPHRERWIKSTVRELSGN